MSLSHMPGWLTLPDPEMCRPFGESKANQTPHDFRSEMMGHFSVAALHHRHQKCHHLSEGMNRSFNVVRDQSALYWSSMYFFQSSQVGCFHPGNSLVKISPWRGSVWNLGETISGEYWIIALTDFILCDGHCAISFLKSCHDEKLSTCLELNLF